MTQSKIEQLPDTQRDFIDGLVKSEYTSKEIVAQVEQQLGVKLSEDAVDRRRKALRSTPTVEARLPVTDEDIKPVPENTALINSQITYWLAYIEKNGHSPASDAQLQLWTQKKIEIVKFGLEVKTGEKIVNYQELVSAIFANPSPNTYPALGQVVARRGSMVQIAMDDRGTLEWFDKCPTPSSIRLASA